ncbi:hypothetical protein OS493_020550 [Desmophyllum pertusum]|uniref:NACHT domain-containing protein n=1 Tax=Desmophyllum pertusum TaxID=174260 RepID=A0A9W9YZ76_9CNID|nr:hypothetical protein OS493_020550 [Desmophyllum pertusum]
MRSLRDVISRCSIFPEGETALTEGLLSYITNNQEKVLLVFDSYDEYRCGSNSEIYDIFRGKKLRNCCVLITTRISKGDELREFKDVHAEITGFSEEDREAFMRRMLGGETEAKELRSLLSWKKLEDLARVPLLLLFFCTLWKKGKLNCFPESKTKLYLAIVQHVLYYSQGKHSPARFGKVEDFKEILAEIGKVALECLLKDDHFQFYITELRLYCDGHVRLFEETTNISVPSLSVNLCSEQSCLKFLTSLRCRLRDQTWKGLGGAIRNSKHLQRIKVDDSDDSVCDLLEQVVNPSKCSLEIDRNVLTSVGTVTLASLLPRFNNIISLCLDLIDCCASAVDTLVPSITHKTLRRLMLFRISLTPAVAAALSRSLPEMSSLQTLELFGAYGSIVQAEEMEALFDICVLGEFNMDERNLCHLLESLRFIPNLEELRVTGKLLSHAHCCTAEVNTAASFTHKTLRSPELRGISLTPVAAAALRRSLPEMSSLETLKLTEAKGSIVQAEEMEALFGGFNKTLSLEDLNFSGFSLSSCLAPLTKSFRFFPNLRNLCLDEFNMDERNLCHLLESLRFIPNLEELMVRGEQLSHVHCCTAEVNTAASFTHKTLRSLELRRISLTPAVAAALGRSLPEMSSLETLELTLAKGSIVQAEEMEALFGGFNTTLPLENLTVTGFSASGCLAPLTKSLRYFPNLSWLDLYNLNMDERNLRGLLESFRFIPNLAVLILSHNPLGHAVTSIVPHIIKLPKLQSISIDQTGSKEDLNYVRETIKQANPHVQVSF